MSPKNVSNQSNVRLGYNLGLLGLIWVKLVENLVYEIIHFLYERQYGRVVEGAAQNMKDHRFDSGPR